MSGAALRGPRPFFGTRETYGTGRRKTIARPNAEIVLSWNYPATESGFMAPESTISLQTPLGWVGRVRAILSTRTAGCTGRVFRIRF